MGKGIMFMMWMWLMTSLAGGIMQGNMTTVTTTTLAQDLTVDGDTIYVTSTTGFPDSGFIVITDERIGYSVISPTTFSGSIAYPVIRGASGTDASAHSAGAKVRTVESAMFNSSMNYKVALLTDTAGVTAFLTIPLALLSLIASFFVLPISYLGTELEILTYVWAVIGIGMLVAIGIALAGGRRV